MRVRQRRSNTGPAFSTHAAVTTVPDISDLQSVQIRRYYSSPPPKRRETMRGMSCHRSQCLCRCRKTLSAENDPSLPLSHIGTLSTAKKAAMMALPLSSRDGEIMSSSLPTVKSPNYSRIGSCFVENDIVVDTDGTVLSGSIEALIKRLIPTNNHCPDRNYIFALLLNLRTFISPLELMGKILQACMFEQNASAGNFSKAGRSRMFAHVLQLSAEWVDTIPYDFRDSEMRRRLEELLGLCMVDKSSQHQTQELIINLKNMLNKLDRYEKALKNLRSDSKEPMQPASDVLTGLLTVCDKPSTIAHQLTHIEMERFNMIGSDEILDALANDDISCLGKAKSTGSLGNIAHYIDWFNRVSQFVASEVLRHTHKRHRVQAIEFFIDVAKECIDVGNFNSLMAIVAGLSLPSIARLKRTWSRVEKCKLDILQHQLDPSGNFLSYRATLKAAIWRAEGARNETQQIVIPFFVLLLKDLFLVYHSGPRTLTNGHLNLVIFARVSEQVRNVVEWKKRRCVFPRNAGVLQYLLLAPVYTDKQLMLLSFESEAPESSGEKEQFKKLKLEKQL